MLLLLSFLSAVFAQEPALTITVTDSKYEEIYMEDPRVICSVPCSFDQDISLIFVEANRHHKQWLKHGKISGIYDDETIKHAYEDCNFKTNPHGCARENGLWVMKTTISIDSERASINIMIFDDTAAMIGQGTYTRFKKTRVIERTRVTQQRAAGITAKVENCNKDTGNCATLPIGIPGGSISHTEDLEPVVINIVPTLTARDVGQTMIMAYDSIRE